LSRPCRREWHLRNHPCRKGASFAFNQGCFKFKSNQINVAGRGKVPTRGLTGGCPLYPPLAGRSARQLLIGHFARRRIWRQPA
jgi:hypothetical protein